LRVDASETVGSLSGGNATRGSVNINGAGVTLTTGADNTTSTFSGSIIGAGGLTKSGSGTFTMDGAKSYTGNTAVTGGTLSTNSISLADAADVMLTTGSFFNLGYTGTDDIRSLFIDNVLQAAGTWGGTGSGAAHISTLLTGSGLLNAAVGAVAGLPGDFNSDGKVDAADYVTWRKNNNTNNALANDNGLGTPVGSAHYDLWRANFGNPPGSGSSLSGAAVPEPGTLVFAIFGVVLAVVTGRRR
jgi:autotransporter-associated beta strand protein